MTDSAQTAWHHVAQAYRVRPRSTCLQPLDLRRTSAGSSELAARLKQVSGSALPCKVAAAR